MVQIAAYSAGGSLDEILANAGGGSMPHIPDGTYKGIIVDSELKDSKNGGKFLALKVILSDGQYANTEFTERLNIVNSNDTAVKIAYETLARIAKAVGLATLPNDSTMLHNRPMMVKVVTEAGTPFVAKDGSQQQGKDKSVLDSKGYSSIAGAMAPVAGAYAGTAAATAQAPVAQAPAAAQAMPWQR